MRIIDIYRKDSNSASGFAIIATNCIQIGNADCSHTLNAKTYTMSDGSITMYPVQKDKSQITLTLECSEEKASAIEKAIHFGQFYIAGARAGSYTTATPTEARYNSIAKKAFSSYIMGACKISKLSTCLYHIELPVQIDFSESKSIPVISTTFGAREGFCRFARRRLI